MKAVVSGVVGAALTAMTIFLWFQVERWLVRGSAYTDLPGQDTHDLVIKLRPYVIALIAVVAGRLSARVSRNGRWIAAIVSVLPILLLTALSSERFWFWYFLGPLLALVGAYAPKWMSDQTRKRSQSDLPEA
jgi:hypothetical protein